MAADPATFGDKPMNDRVRVRSGLLAGIEGRFIRVIESHPNQIVEVEIELAGQPTRVKVACWALDKIEA